MDDPKPRSLWRLRSAPGVTVRVMGVVENYVVFRRKGASPYLLHRNRWMKQYEPQGGEP